MRRKGKRKREAEKRGKVQEEGGKWRIKGREGEG